MCIIRRRPPEASLTIVISQQPVACTVHPPEYADLTSPMDPLTICTPATSESLVVSALLFPLVRGPLIVLVHFTLEGAACEVLGIVRGPKI